MKKVMFYHANCRDGIASAAVGHHIGEIPKENLIPMSYGDDPPYEMLGPDDTLYVCDFSFPVEIIRNDIVLEGRAVRTYLKERYATQCETHAYLSKFATPDGERRTLTALCMNTPVSSSEVFESIYDPNKHDIMVCYSREASGCWKYSLRSTQDYVDCSAIARFYGGGGHKGAAGFSLDHPDLI